VCQALPAAGPDTSIITLLMQGPRYALALGETKVCEFLNNKKVLYAVVVCKEYIYEGTGFATVLCTGFATVLCLVTQRS